MQTSQHRALSQTLETVTYPTNALLCRAGLLVVVISCAVDDGLDRAVHDPREATMATVMRVEEEEAAASRSSLQVE